MADLLWTGLYCPKAILVTLMVWETSILVKGSVVQCGGVQYSVCGAVYCSAVLQYSLFCCSKVYYSAVEYRLVQYSMAGLQ